MRLSHTTLDDQDVDLRRGPSVLGPGLVLRGCRIRLPASAKSVTMVAAELVDCVVEASRPFINFQGWRRAALVGCRFRGRFAGNDFGRWPEAEGVNGSISAADFSSSEPDGCRFMNVARAEVSLPGWPFFVVEDPARRVPDLIAREWPGKVRFFVEGLEYYPQDASFVVFDAETVARQFGSSSDELRDALRAAGCSVG